MASLGKELQETIRNLEKIRDSQKRPSDELLDILDALYEQQIQLIDAAVNNATPQYKSATRAMKAAAKKTKQTLDDIKLLDQSIKKIARAIGKVTDLLAEVT